MIRLKIGFLIFLFAMGLILTLFRVELFPFATYRMFSLIQPQGKFLTLAMIDKLGARRLVENQELAPSTRLNLNYLLVNYFNSSSAAIKSVDLMVKGFFTQDMNLEKIAIVEVKIQRSESSTKMFEIGEIKNQKEFLRSEFGGQ